MNRWWQGSVEDGAILPVKGVDAIDRTSRQVLDKEQCDTDAHQLERQQTDVDAGWLVT